MHRALVPILAATIVVGILATVSGVRWAKRHPRSGQFIASSMMLVFSMVAPVVVQPPPEQRIEEAREDKGKKGSESGDPPSA